MTITAPDNHTSRSYNVTLTRASLAASSDATLRGLAVHTATSNQPDASDTVPYAGTAYTLTPEFAAGVYDYRVRVPEAVVRAAYAAEEYVYLAAVPTTTAPGAKSIVVNGKRSTEEARGAQAGGDKRRGQRALDDLRGLRVDHRSGDVPGREQ